MAERVGRRDFLGSLGITVGAAALAGAAAPILAPGNAEAAEPPKGRLPDMPLKMGHMMFFTGPAAVRGALIQGAYPGR
jgi:hypothetical protein